MLVKFVGSDSRADL
jgi:hypothetical protein